ncbi:MAG: SCO6880 family protein [Acidimicrobiales bacterium]
MKDHTQEQERQVTHIFGPLERRGVIAGWRGGQLVAVASGLLVDAIILRIAPSIGGLAAAVVITCLAVGMATVPVHGQSVEEWLPGIASFVLALVTKHGIKVSLVPDEGTLCNLLYSGSSGSDTPASGHRLAGLDNECLTLGTDQDPSSSVYPNQGLHPGQSSSTSQWRSDPDCQATGQGYHGAGQFSRAFPVLTFARHPFDRFKIMEGYPDGDDSALGDLHGTGRQSGIGSQRVGIIYDPRYSTYTAAFSVQPYGFLLDAPDEQHQKVRAWAFALASLAREGSPVYRVQWLARATPGNSQEMNSYYNARRDPAIPFTQRRSYEELLSRTIVGARHHELFIALTVRAGSSWKRRASSASLRETACTQLLREMAAFKRKLQGAGGAIGPIMSADAYRECILGGWYEGGVGNGEEDWSGEGARDGWTRRSGEEGWPGGDIRAGGNQRTGGGGEVALAGAEDGEFHRAGWPWPLATEEHWDYLRAESCWHSTYWVSQWPRIPVPSDFLSPLLLLPDVRFSFSMVMEPVAPLKAVRQVEQARTDYLADSELRQRGGFLRTERQRREHETLIQREQELAEGHGQFRFSSYATVGADDLESLYDARHRFEQAAGQAHIDTRLLYGRQLEGLIFTLPLAQGLS